MKNISSALSVIKMLTIYLFIKISYFSSQINDATFSYFKYINNKTLSIMPDFILLF